ncbi:MAG TPA: ABC transporter ATP-binding protein, partial [Terriglobales bacterium]|nr:ABC transporter ATP-binding protein [Terriglobales bacterium]
MIHFESLTKEFGNLIAVSDLNLDIPEGEIYGLIGPNGAGKTTTIRMACGLLTPTAGKVFVAGVEVHKEPERAQQHMGYLSDFFSLYDDLTVWEYLDYFARAYKMDESDVPGRIDEVIGQVGLEVKRDLLIKGLSRWQAVGFAAFLNSLFYALLDPKTIVPKRTGLVFIDGMLPIRPEDVAGTVVA